MGPGRLLLGVAAAFAALWLLRSILRIVRGGLAVDQWNDLKARGALVVDVRTSGEYAGGAAPGSLNIPLDQLPHRLGELPKDRPLVLCCATGSRSQYAKRFLERSGFTEVYNAGSWQACR